MLKVRPKMFEEASKSHGSPSLIIIMLIFVVVFIIIYVAEAIIPSIVSLKPMLNELNDQGFLDGSNHFSLSESMKIATKVSSAPKVMITMLISTVFGTLISVLYCRCIEMRPISSMGVRKRKLALHYVVGLAVGIVLMSSIALLSVAVGVNSISLCSNINFGLIALYFLGFFFQGMSEEFIFRGYLMNSIGGHHSAALAVGISSVAFGLAHAANQGFNLLSFINLVLFAVFAALYMIRYDDIWGVSAIHTIWNFTQGNFYGISVSGSADTESVFRTTAKSSHDFLTGGGFGIEGSIFTTIVLAAAIAVMLFMIKRALERAQIAE